MDHMGPSGVGAAESVLRKYDIIRLPRSAPDHDAKMTGEHGRLDLV